jgi:hypothetical protein
MIRHGRKHMGVADSALKSPSPVRIAESCIVFSCRKGILLTRVNGLPLDVNGVFSTPSIADVSVFNLRKELVGGPVPYGPRSLRGLDPLVQWAYSISTKKQSVWLNWAVFETGSTWSRGNVLHH